MKGLIWVSSWENVFSKLVIYQDLNKNQILNNKFLVNLNIEMISNLILEQIGKIDLIFMRKSFSLMEYSHQRILNFLLN